MSRYFKLPRRDISIDATWDIETQGWDTFVFGGIRYKQGGYSDFRWDEEDEFVECMLGIDGTIWAHFGGGFDFKWFLDKIGPMGVKSKIVRAGNRIVTIELKHLRLCDSFALAPMTLEELTSGMGISKAKLDLPCVCGDDCGGYCSIKVGMGGADLDQLRHYLKRDCDSLFNSLGRIQDFASEHDLDLGQTIGGSAWRNAKRFTGIGSATPEQGGLPVARYQFARNAYYGGRTQLYRKCVRLMKSGKVIENPVPKGNGLDVCSMYPWALKTFAVPVGAHSMHYGRNATSALVRSEPGLYRCAVTVPEMFIPPLPARYKDGTAIGYPTGSFCGVWPLPEIEWAIERGCSVQAIEALTWENESHVFSDWINKLWGLRDSADPTTPLGTWLKLYMNSLTGKFGSNPVKEQYVMNPDEIRFCQCKCQSCNALLRRCRCPVERFDPPECKCNPMLQRTDYVWSSESYQIEDCAHVQFCGYLTSYSRVHLNRGQVSDGHDGESILMSDTDSIYSEGDEILNILSARGQVGKQLGQFKHEGPFRDFIGVAPKVYSYLCSCGRNPCMRRSKKDPGPCDNTLVSKAKGITLPKNRLTNKPTERPIVGKQYAKSGIIGVGTGLKNGRFFVARNTSRRIAPRMGDRVVLEDRIHTRPPDARELALDEGFTEFDDHSEY